MAGLYRHEGCVGAASPALSPASSSPFGYSYPVPCGPTTIQQAGQELTDQEQYLAAECPGSVPPPPFYPHLASEASGQVSKPAFSLTIIQ